MTHEYTIAVGGIVYGAELRDPLPTAIAWAGGRILAIGDDDAVTAISRGDSHIVQLIGRAVTPLPADRSDAEDTLRAAVVAGEPFDPGRLAKHRLEIGGRADLAIWSADPRSVPAGDPDAAGRLRIESVVRQGRLEPV